MKCIIVFSLRWTGVDPNAIVVAVLVRKVMEMTCDLAVLVLLEFSTKKGDTHFCSIGSEWRKVDASSLLSEERCNLRHRQIRIIW
jgi:hypothetical protein